MNRRRRTFRGISDLPKPPAGHEHVVDKRLPVLDIGWCGCGEEFHDGRWRTPRTTEGLTRRMNYRGGE